MRTTCAICDTSYTIPDDRIGPKGRKVRCTKCGEEWRVMRAEEVVEPEPEVEPEFEPVGSEKVADEAFDPFEAVGKQTDEDAAEAAFESASKTPDPFDEVDTASATAEADADEAAADEGSQPEIATTDEEPTTRQALPPSRGAKGRKDTRFRPKHRLRLPPVLVRAAAFVGPVFFVTVLLAVAGMIFLRGQVVAAVPGLAGFYAQVGLPVNVRGLTIGEIETLREMDEGKPVLVVEGTLANDTNKARAVPALRFALRDEDSQELWVWSIDPRADTIAAGDRLRFRTRLVAPPERAADLMVRFAERRNRQAGLP